MNDASKSIRKNTGFYPLAALLTIFAVLAVVYNLVLPLAEISDAGAHFALIRFIVEHKRPPMTIQERTEVGIKGDASPVYHGLVALLTQHGDVSEFPDLPDIHDEERRTIPTDGRIIQGIFHTEDESFPFKGIALAWHLAGLASIPMGMATIIAVYLTGRAVYPARPYFALGAAAFAGLLPRFLISSAVINDDNLVFPLIAFSVYFLIKIIQGDERLRTFAILGALMGLAAVTKYHSLILVPEMTLVVLGLAISCRWGWKAALWRWGACLAAFLLLSGWWYGFVLIRFNEVDDSGLVGGLAAPLGDPVLTLGLPQLLNPEFNAISIREFDYWLSWSFRTFWMHYNGIYTGMQAMGREPVYWAFFGGLVTLASLALIGLLKKATIFSLSAIKALPSFQTWRPDISLLAVHLLIYLGLAMLRYMLFPAWSTSQGRHLYPALSSIGIFFVLGLSEFIGGTNRRDQILAFGLGGLMLAINLFALGGMVRPVYHPYLPLITIHPDDAPISHPMEVKLDDGLRFEGYDLSPQPVRAGKTISLTLYWRTRERQEQDYLIQVCLHDKSDQVVTCREGYPVDGRYPIRAWEPGYLIRDEIHLPTPDCLSPGAYQLSLTLLPLQSTTVNPTVDDAAHTKPPISLGEVSLTAGQSADSFDFSLWIGDQVYRRGKITLWQLRQAITVFSYSSSPDQTVLFRPVGDRAPGQPPWLPISEPLRYTCSDEQTVFTHNFSLHPGVQAENYHLQVDQEIFQEPLLRISTRHRNFSPPVDTGTTVNATAGDVVKLLGYEVKLSPREPGEQIKITTYWQALRTTDRNYIGSFHLLDNNLTMWSQSDHPLGSGYPNILWAPGEIVEDVHYLRIHDYVAAGQYRLKLSVYDFDEGRFDFLPLTTPTTSNPTPDLFLGQVRVLDPAHATPPTYPLRVELNRKIELAGYDLEQTDLVKDHRLEVALHWRALESPSHDYTVFTQLIGPDNLVWAQQDNQPQGGSYPTRQWTPAEKVVDRYVLQLKEGAPAGQYRLLVGMYDLNTGQRLPAINAEGQRLPNDAIELATLTIE